MSFKHLNEIFVSLAEMLRPPERMSVTASAEKYVYLNNPGSYVGPYSNRITQYMAEPMNTYNSPQFIGMIFVAPAQCGKALALDTPIAIPQGWTTMGELRVGDQVFGADGKPCNVTMVTPVMHNHDCYDVQFEDGSAITADADHRWYVRDDVRERKSVMTTQEMVDAGVKYGARSHRNRFAVANGAGLTLPEVELPIDPYLMGVWLGDGCSYDDNLYLNAADTRIVNILEMDGNDVLVRHNQKSKNCINVKMGVKLRKPLRAFDLISSKSGGKKGKFIPAVYLRAAYWQRLALLQGLLDTDGSASIRGRVEFATIHLRLACEFRELCASLGFKTTVSEDIPTYSYKGEKRKGQLAYTVSFTAYQEDRVFTLARQNARLGRRDDETRRTTQSGSRRITAITPRQSVPVRCITVDSCDHLYLAGDQMIPTHNTQSLILNAVAYSIKIEPMDTMVVCPTMVAARDFSIRRIDRLIRYSKDIKEMLVPGGSNDNTFDKHFKNGMLLSMSWPTPTELAGKPIGRIVMTDRDRMVDDVDGDGEPFDLASKRTTTFGSYAMTVAESSPSRPITNPKWIAHSAHEAPPCDGILGLYNRGDRRRWYWPCPHCGEYFEGNFKHLVYDRKPGLTNLEIAETVRMVCPHHGCIIHPDDREEMQFWGVWVKDGQAVDRTGLVFGPAPRTMIASFWLNGVAAAFTSWKKLVAMYLDANDDYERSGSEEGLKKFYNNDLGEPYVPKNQTDIRLPESLKARAEHGHLERHVPEGVRFLVSTIDVQKNMWRVNTFGVLPGKPFDTIIVDRYDVRKSQRQDADGERLWVKPNTYLEDWEELIPHVIEREYPLGDGSGRMMGVKFVGCDLHGADGVTTMAYNFYRLLREKNKHRRFILLRGDSSPGAPRTRITYPDSNRKDAKAGARGDIPVLQINTNLVKDDLNGRLDCMVPGKGMYRYPDWMPDAFYNELCAEIRTAKGWENPAGHRNEDFDLSAYCLALCVSAELLRVEHLDWDNPPGWAAPWEKNDFVRQAEEAPRFAPAVHSAQDFAALALALA